MIGEVLIVLGMGGTFTSWAMYLWYRRKLRRAKRAQRRHVDLTLSREQPWDYALQRCDYHREKVRGLDAACDLMTVLGALSLGVILSGSIVTLID